MSTSALIHHIQWREEAVMQPGHPDTHSAERGTNNGEVLALTSLCLTFTECEFLLRAQKNLIYQVLCLKKFPEKERKRG